MTSPLAAGLSTRDMDPATSLLQKILNLQAEGFAHCHISRFPTEASRADITVIRSTAEGAGVALSIGIGQINPSRPHRVSMATSLGHGNLKEGIFRALDICKKLGAGQAHFTVGTLEDRAAKDIPWPEQLRRASELLDIVSRHAEELHIDLVLKTHEEMTTFELHDLLTNVGSSQLGAGFSPVNVLLRLEHPLKALHRLAPFIKAVFVDDAVMHWNRRGVQRTLVPFGQGDIPWPQILARVKVGRAMETTPVILDIHRAELETAMFQQIDGVVHTDAKPAELAAFQQLIRPDLHDSVIPTSTQSRFDMGVRELVQVTESLRSALSY